MELDASVENVDEIIEEMNHDTITSLRNFVESARMITRSRSNYRARTQPFSNLAASNATSMSNSRSSSFSESTTTRNFLRSPITEARPSRGQTGSVPVIGRATSAQEVDAGGRGSLASEGWRKIFGRRPSLRSDPPDERGRITASIRGISLPDILRDTTLEEFLQALENVEANDNILLTEEEETEIADTSSTDGEI